MRVVSAAPSGPTGQLPVGRNNDPIEIYADDTRDPDYGESADSREPLWAQALKHDMRALFNRELSDLREHCNQQWIQHDSTLKQELRAMFLTKPHDMPSWAMALKTDLQATIREQLSQMYEQWIQPALKKDIKDKTSNIFAETDDGPKEVFTVYGASGDSQAAETAGMEGGAFQVDGEDTSKASPETSVRLDGATRSRRKSEFSVQNEAIEAIRVQNELAALGVTKKKHWTSYNHRTERMVQNFINYTSDLEEPEPEGLAGCIVTSKTFETVCTCVIALNSIFVAYTSNFGVQNLNQQKPVWMSITDQSFTVFYVIEWLLRLSAHRCWFFFSRWNIFDTVVVAISVIDLASEVMLPVGDNDSKNLVVMRVLRFLKLSKLLRTVRALRFFNDLAVLLESFGQSASAFFWALVMLLFMFYVGALIFLQGVGDYLASLDPIAQGYAAHVNDVRRYFGSVELCMLTLFQACTGGLAWPMLYNVLKKCGPTYAVALLFLIFFWEFAFLSVVTGIAVEKATRAARPGRDGLVLDQRLHAISAESELKCMCELFDPDNTGMISYENFRKHMDNDIVLSYFESVGLEVHEVDSFFQLVAGDQRHERVSIDRFVEGCMHMKGEASGVDMQKAIFRISLLREDVGKVMEQNAMIVKSLQLRGLNPGQTAIRSIML